MTSEELRILRARLKLKQSELAEFLSVSPRTLHSLENSNEDVPKKYADLIESTLGVSHEGLSFANKSLAISSKFSWPAPAFDALSAVQGKRVRRLECNVTIRPNSQDGKKYGDVDYKVDYRGLSLSEGERIVVDHIANPKGPGPGHLPASMEFVDKPKGCVDRVKIEAGPGSLGDYAVAYSISNPNFPQPVPDASVHLLSKGGVELCKYDNIGFPVYPDFLIDLLIVVVEFAKLVPEAPRASATLLRRSAYRYGYGPDGPDTGAKSSLDFRPAATGNHRFTYGLIRPRGGYYFGLGWDRLEPLEATRKGRRAT